MMFCKEYNARTQDQPGMIIPVEITVYEDKSFTFILKTPPASVLLKKAAGIAKGAGDPQKDVGRPTVGSMEGVEPIQLVEAVDDDPTYPDLPSHPQLVDRLLHLAQLRCEGGRRLDRRWAAKDAGGDGGPRGRGRRCSRGGQSYKRTTARWTPWIRRGSWRRLGFLRRSVNLNFTVFFLNDD